MELEAICVDGCCSVGERGRQSLILEQSVPSPFIVFGEGYAFTRLQDVRITTMQSPSDAIQALDPPSLPHKEFDEFDLSTTIQHLSTSTPSLLKTVAVTHHSNELVHQYHPFIPHLRHSSLNLDHQLRDQRVERLACEEGYVSHEYKTAQESVIQ